jgi:hypothetical protein
MPPNVPTLDTVSTWTISCEDLILSKLVRARDAQSEVQRRDVTQLLDASVDREYLLYWAGVSGVDVLLHEPLL